MDLNYLIAASLKRTSVLLFASTLLAAQKHTSVVIVADSRHLSGIAGRWVNVYNESHFYFAVLTVISIALGGAILGGIADFIMGRIGIDLKSRELREN